VRLDHLLSMETRVQGTVAESTGQTGSKDPVTEFEGSSQSLFNFEGPEVFKRVERALCK